MDSEDVKTYHNVAWELAKRPLENPLPSIIAKRGQWFLSLYPRALQEKIASDVLLAAQETLDERQ